MEDTKRRLLWHGMFLFLIGLLTGLAAHQFNNPRMGLAAHLEGVMNGTFLVVLGAIWAEVRLSDRVHLGFVGSVAGLVVGLIAEHRQGPRS